MIAAMKNGHEFVLAYERFLAGALLIGKKGDQVAVDQLGDTETVDVLDEPCREIIRAVLNIRDGGGIPDAMSVVAELEREGRLTPTWQSGSDAVSFCMKLMDETPFVWNVREWAYQVQAAAVRRSQLQTAERLISALGSPGIEPETIADMADRIAEMARTGSRNERYQTFETISSAELATNDYELEYLIPGLLVKGQPGVVGAPKKSMKTTLLVALALSLASCSRFLGEFYVTRKYRVCVMSAESGAATLKEIALRIVKTMPWINLEDYLNVIWCFDVPKLGQPNTVKTLIKFIREHRIEVLIIDPLYLALLAGDAASNLYAMGAKLADLTEVTKQTGVTLLLAHHTRKVMRGDFTRFEPPELDDLMGAGISEYARQWLLIRRREEYNPENGGSHRLWLSAGGSAGHSGLWAINIEEGTRQDQGGRRWEVEVSKASEARKEQAEERETLKANRESARQSRDHTKVVDAYKAFPAGETPTKIRNAAGLSGTKFEPINAALLKAGDIEPCTIEKNGRFLDGFRLKSATTGTSGTDRDSTGTNSSCPGEQTGAGLDSPYKGISPGPDAPDNAANPSDQDNPAFCPDGVTATGKRKVSRKKAKERKSPA